MLLYLRSINFKKMDFIQQPIPWYIAGPLIGLTIPMLYFFINKPLGISVSLKQICALCIPTTWDFLKIDNKKDGWRLFFVGGIILSGIIFALTKEPYMVELNEYTIDKLGDLGFTQNVGFVPNEWYGLDTLSNPLNWLIIMIGGFLIGFGTRYAGGCTSGHTIMGLSLLSPASLLATIGFFAGGLIGAWFIVPFISTLL